MDTMGLIEIRPCLTWQHYVRKDGLKIGHIFWYVVCSRYSSRVISTTKIVFKKATMVSDCNLNLRTIPKSLLWGWPLQHPYSRMLPTQGQMIDVWWRDTIAWNSRLHPVSCWCSRWHIADCTNCSNRCYKLLMINTPKRLISFLALKSGDHDPH